MIPSVLIGPLFGLACIGGLFAMDRFHVSQRDTARADLATLRGDLERERMRIRALQDTQTTIAENVATTQRARVERVRTITKTIIQRVPEYVTTVDNSRCVVPVGFVRVYDAAATGDAAPAPGDADRANSGIDLSYVAEVSARNYGACLEFRSEIVAWREWYERIAAADRAAGPANQTVKGAP